MFPAYYNDNIHQLKHEKIIVIQLDESAFEFILTLRFKPRLLHFPGLSPAVRCAVATTRQDLLSPAGTITSTAGLSGVFLPTNVPESAAFVWMEADGFVSRRTSMEAPGVDSRVTGAAAGAELRWLGGRLLDANVTGGFVGSLTARKAGEQDFTPVLYRSPPDTSTSAETEIDYEGLPQGAATSTHMLAGAVAGIMEHCIMYPIDCVKVSKKTLTNHFFYLLTGFQPYLTQTLIA